MSRLSITEASEKTGLSLTQCRYWSKLLEIEISKQGRTSFIPAGAENLLLAMAQSVKAGQAPAVAAVEVKNTFAALPIVQEVHQAPSNNTALHKKPQNGKIINRLLAA